MYREAGFAGNLCLVDNGQGVIDFLEKKGRCENSENCSTSSKSHLIFLNLNMPVKNGIETHDKAKNPRAHAWSIFAI